MDKLTRVCASCEREFGVKVPGKKVSHGFCKRHYIDQLKTWLTEIEMQRILQKDMDFPQDLSDHPEYVMSLREIKEVC